MLHSAYLDRVHLLLLQIATFNPALHVLHDKMSTSAIDERSVSTQRRPRFLRCTGLRSERLWSDSHISQPGELLFIVVI